MKERSKPPQKCGSFTDIFFKFLIFPLIFYVAIVIWYVATKPDPTPVVLTADGPVQGNIRYSRDGKQYWEFLGIPYAMPPENERLFQPPVLIEPWTNVKQVTSFPPDCVQFDPMIHSRANGEMDCLFLNVFVHVASGNESKAVLVYIYGGAFVSGGSKMYQPEYFMDWDVVLVVMNYRLGPYGFLNLQDGKGFPRGNMGLKDQNVVLQWVQKNIAKFGGDPERVTLVGQSAGAVAAHLHILSPMSRGLFQKAVLQSGSALAPWAFANEPRKVSMDNAKKLECQGELTSDGLMKCFKTRKWPDVLEHQCLSSEPLREKHAFTPSVDGTFLKEFPQEILKSGNFPRIPIMFGVNGGEGGVASARFEAMPEWIQKLDEDWDNLLENYLLVDETLQTKFIPAIRERYFGNESFTKDVDDFRRNITRLASDLGFYYPTHKSALYHAKSGAPTYLYYFNYTSKTFPGIYSVLRAKGTDDWLPVELKILWTTGVDWVKEYVFGSTTASRPYGITHGEDLFQLWNILGLSKYISGRDSDFSRSFVKAIVDFANDTKQMTFRNVNWPSVNEYFAENSNANEYIMPYMLMDDEDVPKVISEPFSSRMSFWNGL